MIGKRLIAAACAALLLPLAAAAENAVEALPTTAPMTEPVVETNEYAFTDLTAYYEDAYEDENGTQKPALTPDEKNRLTEARQRWDAGERPESSILDLMDAGKADMASATSLSLSQAGMQRLLGNLVPVGPELVPVSAVP